MLLLEQVDQCQEAVLNSMSAAVVTARESI